MSLGEAFRNCFGYRGDVLGRDIKELFRLGRRALVVGLSVLIVLRVPFISPTPREPG